MMDFRHDGFGDGRARGISLKAAATATWTQATARVNSHMTDFTGGSTQAGIQTSILHNTPTNARANKQADERFITLSRSIEVLAQCGDFHIVADGDGFTKLPVELFAQGHIFHAQVGRIDDYTCLAVNLTGRAYTNRDDAGII